MLSPFENIEITIIEIKTILPMSEDIGSWGTNLMVANLVFFTAFWWLWEKRTKTHRGSLVVFVFFMITFTFATTSAILAALGNSLCKIVQGNFRNSMVIKMQMRVFRCRICGEAYIGEGIPTHCPFCGALSKYLVPAERWIKGQDQVRELSSHSRESLEKALGLELSNTGFYQAASKAGSSQLVMAMFKRLSKVELEHAKTISKIIKPPEWEVKEEKAGQDRENIGNALKREDRAARFYGQALSRATEPRVRELFRALIEVETTHTNLLENVQAKLK